MKNIFKILLLFSFFFYSDLYAINVDFSNNKTNHCPGDLNNVSYYINGNSISDFLYDTVFSSDDRLISNNSTQVTIWTSDSSLLSGCNNDSSWEHLSDLSPGSNQRVIALGANCTFNKPTDLNKRTLQFVFNIGYYDIFPGAGQLVGDHNLDYFTSTGAVETNTPNYIYYSDVGFDDLNIHENECLNIELRYCGDGILETGNGEQCDDGNNINLDGCDSTCSTEVKPVCSAGVTGTQSSVINENTSNLCNIAGQTVENFTSTTSGTTTNYTWGCNDGTTTYTGGNCSASYESGDSSSSTSTSSSSSSSSSSSGGSSSSSSSSSGGSSSSSSSSSGGSSSNFCGDGIVQRPNDNLEMEECDFGSESDWLFCNADCTYSNLTIPGSGGGDITIPNGGKIVFGPEDSVIIGSGMNPYVSHSLSKPYIKNLSDYDLYFDSLCVSKTSGTTLVGSTTCENIGSILSRGDSFYMSSYPNFIGANNISGDYGDNVLSTTIKHDGVLYDSAYFIGDLKVRVAKSSVATLGGGTSYIGNSTGISSLARVSNGILDTSKNKNFIGVGVGNDNTTSYSNNINNSDSIDKVKLEGNTFDDNIDNLSNSHSSSIGTTSVLSEFEQYNGISNVFILKDKSFEVTSSTFSSVSGARTYIVENGDLIINGNIDYSDNISFAVKGGDIKIDKSVSELDGTYITIYDGASGGSFIGTNGYTTDRLLVNGSLYGNLNDLIEKRTYVKQNASGLLDVGTIVSFGSALFRKPAPLLSTFINEYLVSEKVAK